MYTQTTAPVVVSGTPSSGCRPLSAGSDGKLPDDHHRLDIVFIRSQPSSFRCLYNWLYWSTHTAHDVNDKPLDHHTFRNTMQECVSSLGTSVVNVGYLDPHAFPSDCATKCGCNNNSPVEPGPDGNCPKEAMAKWVGYLLGCSGSNPALDASMIKYQNMWAAWNATQGH
ncbi:hypothetical protein HXX76_009450 [Chlamydomonas incerta]|uniref:Uncharacterized protein n=1 Tax=Chlamydomonas incerta TaxID=51695 RepID=A0A835T443_CHLIN|nr:hypothetical protein HXX76_009450 [Chlamydomonas incerta]|eukprot:KAG2431435.1 hypothetical protein HXX76_009450 [Chlamydomonas incerta]